MKFVELQLDPTLQSAIDKSGFAEATPIQAQAIPLVLDKKDVSGLAQTGTGKTAAFALPLMERILRARPLPEDATEEAKALAAARAFLDWRPQNFILVLVPTRELAEQVFENIEKFSEFSGLRAVSVYGGTGYDKQKEAIAKGVEFVVATPGRLIDLYKEHIVDLKQVRAIVFDEADRMFDMGFKDDMKYILQRVPSDRQFLVFSATLNFDVLNTAYQFGAEPVEINISKDQAKADNVKDEIFHVGQDEKPMYLLSLFKKHNPKQVIVFSNFKMNVERIASFLSSNGYPAMAISSLLSQAQRNRVIEQFKSENEKNILVATDVAARGLDIKGVDMVINYELPQDAESYVHRIGRTGRAGTEGQAFSLVSDMDVDSLARVQDYLKNKLSVAWFDDADLVKEFKVFPRESHGTRKFSSDHRRGDSSSYAKGGEARQDQHGGRSSGARSGQSGQHHSGAGAKPSSRGGGGGAHPHRSANGSGAMSARRPDGGQGKEKRNSRFDGSKQDHRPDLRLPRSERGFPQATQNRAGENEKSHKHSNGSTKSRHQSAARSAAQKPRTTSVVQKISSFFKKLLGPSKANPPRKNS